MIIEFSHAGGVINYPDDQNTFKWSKYLPDKGVVIGEYTGTKSLTPYSGEWPTPTYVKQLSKTDFKGLFTASEYRAISTLASNDDNAFQFWDMAQTADNIDLDDPRTQAGLSYVSGMGAVSAERLAVINLGKKI
jgi:hypothetical protein